MQSEKFTSSKLSQRRESFYCLREHCVTTNEHIWIAKKTNVGEGVMFLMALYSYVDKYKIAFLVKLEHNFV